MSKHKQSYSVASFYESIENSYVKEKEVIDIKGHNITSFDNYSKLAPFNEMEKIISTHIDSIDILKTIFASNLCGCGGSHMPLVKKWEAAIPNHPRYLVVNGLEGEPFTFKDYFIMMHYPSILLEGIAITCRLLKIKEVYLVINSAYKQCYQNLKQLIENKPTALDKINIHLKYGPNPDLYIVGEETALLNYIEGKRAEPRLKPPYPHEKGLWNQATVINNVETLSWIPIILNTPERFKHYHPKLITLLGDTKYPGIYEVDIGEPFINVITRANCNDFSFIEVGGISGGLIPKELINDISYHNNDLDTLNVQIGSGTLRVFNSSHDPLQEMSKSIDFFRDESCGRCTPCRVGTQELSKFAMQLKENKETHESINWLHSVAETMQTTSTCGLGQAAALPVLTYLKYFWKQ